jgi:hypothetical protein
VRPLHNSILASFIIFFTMKSMVSFQIFARIRVMQRSQGDLMEPIMHFGKVI